ncbi:MAG: terminase [Ignavibacteriales bacterium]|nr:MAG: terminase [Ignavibacteriales bacterium]
MTKKYKKLNETFNIDDNSDEVIHPEIAEESPKEIVTKKETLIDDIRKDYEYTRGNLYSIIEKGQEAINNVLELAQETDAPRAYEVVGQLIKNVSDATDKLMDLQKKIKALDETKQQRGPTNVTNALFVGSTAELSKMLKSQLKNVNGDK